MKLRRVSANRAADFVGGSGDAGERAVPHARLVKQEGEREATVHVVIEQLIGGPGTPDFRVGLRRRRQFIHLYHGHDGSPDWTSTVGLYANALPIVKNFRKALQRQASVSNVGGKARRSRRVPWRSNNTCGG